MGKEIITPERAIVRPTSEQFGEVLWNFFDKPPVSRFFRVEVTGQENIAMVRKGLTLGQQYYVVHSHEGTLDPAYNLKLRRDFFPECLSVAYFMPQKMKDGRMPFFQWTIEYGKSIGLVNKTFLVLQKNDDEKRKKLTQEEIKELDQGNVVASLGALHYMKNTPSSWTVVAGTGTRSLDGKIHPILDAVPKFFELAGEYYNTQFLPIAIEGSQRVHRKGSWVFNPLAMVRVHVGKPLTYKELKLDAYKWNVTIKDAMNIHIGRLHPIEDWDQYHQYKLKGII